MRCCFFVFVLFCWLTACTVSRQSMSSRPKSRSVCVLRYNRSAALCVARLLIRLTPTMYFLSLSYCLQLVAFEYEKLKNITNLLVGKSSAATAVYAFYMCVCVCARASIPLPILKCCYSASLHTSMC